MSGTRAISTKSRRELSSSFFLQGQAPKEIHAILTETLVCFLPGRAKDLSALLYKQLGRSQWPRSRRRKTAAARLLGFEFISRQGHGCLSLINVACCRVSCEGPITHPEESYRVWMCDWVWSGEKIISNTYSESVENFRVKTNQIFKCSNYSHSLLFKPKCLVLHCDF